MFKLSDIAHKIKIFNKKEQEPSQSERQSFNAIKTVKNWYEEKYDKISVQRNLLLVLILVLLVLSIVSVIALSVIVNSRKFDPFVIQIDQSTGVARVVNPVSSQILDGDEALAKYFIKKYIVARETYNPVDFDTEARKTVRLLSTSAIYMRYLGYIRNKDFDPSLIYGQKNTTFLVVKSWTKLDKKKYMLRFSINETSENKKVFNRIAVVDFDYVAMELTEAERDINPIGFQIKEYRVDDDNS